MPLTSKPARPAGLERTRRSLVVVAVLSVLLAASTTSALPAQAATPTTYQGPAYPTATGPPSADKPQSKLWYADGRWWGLLRTSSGITIHRLDGDHVWRDTGTVVDERLDSTGDALWDGQRLYVASRTAGSRGALRVVRLSYDDSRDTYTRDSSQQVGSGGSESVTIAKDSRQRLWITYTQGYRVRVAHTTTSETTWTAPFLPAVDDTSISSDDIAAVIAFDGKIGVMYSDQASQVMHFAVHDDDAPDDVWTLERALPNASLSGPKLADDHINLKGLVSDDQGRIYAAVKTSRGDAGEPLTDPSVVVLQRTSTGTWTGAAASAVGDKLTRAQLALDRTGGHLYVLMAIEGGGATVYYKRTALGALSFAPGRGSAFITASGGDLNNPSTSKQAVDATTGLVVLASDDTAKRYYHGQLALGSAGAADTSAPSVPQGVSATAASSSSVAVSWTASTDDTGVSGYRVFRDGALVATTAQTSYTDTGLTASTSYSYRVAAFDAAGNTSAQSSAATATTAAAEPQPEPTGDVPAFVGASTASGATTSTTVPVPAGTGTGDVLVAAVSVRGSALVPAPAGWTQVRVDANSTTMRQAVFVRTATAGEGPATFTLSKNGDHVVQVLAYRGVDTTDPVVGSSGAVSTSTAIVSPVLSSVANARVVTIAGIARTATLTPASPLTERAEVTNPSTASYKITAGTGDTAATGTSTGPYTTTASGSAGGIGQALTLRPAG